MRLEFCGKKFLNKRILWQKFWSTQESFELFNFFLQNLIAVFSNTIGFTNKSGTIKFLLLRFFFICLGDESKIKKKRDLLWYILIGLFL